MRRFAILPFALCALAVHAQSAQRPEVAAAAKAEQAKLIAWRRDFHQNPELSNREERTAAKVAEHRVRSG
jgi:amidohydrolase